MACVKRRVAMFATALVASVCLAAGAEAVVLGGSGAPQSVHCKAVGGTEDGSYCVLPNGDYCESMTLFRDGVCKGPDGEVQSEEDFGSNDGTDDPGDVED